MRNETKVSDFFVKFDSGIVTYKGWKKDTF